MTVRLRDREDFFLGSQAIPHAVLILGIVVPVHSAAEVSARIQALAISTAREVGKRCRETRTCETSAATRAYGIHLETRAAGRCPRRRAARETRWAAAGILSGA